MDLTLDELRAAFAADSTNPSAYRGLVSALTNQPEGRELAELHEHAAKCERLLVLARGVMRGELELTQLELLAEIGEAIDEPEVER